MSRRHAQADVAVYAPYAGPLYELEAAPLGGAETQSGYLARRLVEHGFKVAHIVWGHDLVAGRDGVEVVALGSDYARGGLRRRRAVIDALRRADARLYIQRSAGFETGVVGVFARATGRRFVFSSSSLADFSRDRRMAVDGGTSLDEWPTRLQYAVGLRAANAVVTQTDEQRELAHQRGIEARVIRSFCRRRAAPTQRRDAFLWIGGLVGFKVPLAYVELARAVPECRFRMVVGERGEAWRGLAEETRRRAAEVPNLELTALLPQESLADLYARAVAVVNTSWFEGFPNTFLEGWSLGTPALSLRVDPDSTIERNGLGVACAGSPGRMASEARRLWAHRDEVDPEPLRRYVERVHDPSVVGPQWAAVVSKLLDG